jgi:hypothetical protein
MMVRRLVALALLAACLGCGGDDLSFCEGCGSPTTTPTTTPDPSVTSTPDAGP